MKKNLLFVILILGIYACKREQHSNAPVKRFDYDKAESFFNKNNDSAFFYFNEVATNSSDSLQIAMAYNYMAIIQADAGDYFGSIESSLASLKFLNEKKTRDFNCLSSNYNELATNNLNLKNYDEALKYFDLAIKYTNNEESKRTLLNNKALIYRAKKEYGQAVQIYRQVMPEEAGNKIQYARLLTNFAFTKWLQNPHYNAKPTLLEALHIREKEEDQWGQNSSYAHLAEYYTKNQPDSALFYANKRYRIAKQLKSSNDQIGALQKLIELAPPNLTKQYFKAYQQLNDSVQLARSAAKNQFALIRYEVEKNKADNLRLQKDNAEKAYQIGRQRIWTAMVVLLAIIFSIIGVYWYKKRKQRLALEAQHAIQEHRLRTSKKIHDVVANGIYRVMAEIENQSHIDRGDILDRLEYMYEKSRDISYEAEESLIRQQNFNERITDLLRSFATPATTVIIAGNETNLWEAVNERAKYEIEHVLQELMVNMKKHSQATRVVIRFEQRQNEVYIYYADNGIGMPEGHQFHNGLTNTGNRIKSIGGEIIFDTKVEKGLKIQISFPPFLNG